MVPAALPTEGRWALPGGGPTEWGAHKASLCVPWLPCTSSSPFPSELVLERHREVTEGGP